MAYVKGSLSSLSKTLCNRIQVLNETYDVDHVTNITPSVLSLLERKHHLTPNHPLQIVKQKVYDYFKRKCVDTNNHPLFSTFDNLSPVTTTVKNFDELLTPEGHKDRSEIERIYINKHVMLRSHMSAHVVDLIKKGHNSFMCTGDVYRFDEYDNTHNCLFHQMEFVQLLTREELFSNSDQSIFDESFRTSTVDTEERQLVHTGEAVAEAMSIMMKHIKEIIAELLGDRMKYRWKRRYLQFSRPEYDMEVLFNDEWLEIATAGIIKQSILDNAGATDKIGWDFTFGLDRIAMVLFNIPDIRLLSSTSEKVIATLSKDPTAYSSAPAPSHWREIVFLIPRHVSSAAFEYGFYEFLRTVAEEDVEKVEMVDNYQHPKTERVRHRYHITYRNWEKPLSKEDVNMCHDNIKKMAQEKLNVELEQL